jgi:hypothetical protein
MPAKKLKRDKHSETLFLSMVDDMNNSPEWISEILRENNIDETKLANDANQLAGRLLAEMKLKSAKAEKKSIFDRALSLFDNVKIEIQSFDPRQKLFELLNARQNTPSFTFNNLKEFSNKDVLEMLNEIELLQLIEELEKNKENT